MNDREVFQRDFLSPSFVQSWRTHLLRARPVRVRSQKSVRASGLARPVLSAGGRCFQVVGRKCWQCDRALTSLRFRKSRRGPQIHVWFAAAYRICFLQPELEEGR
jgi:hypothetical protein